MIRQTGYLEHEGEKIYFESIGEGPPLVLSHGAGGNHAIWFQQVAYFAKFRQVILWDQRGFGRSTAISGANSPERGTRDLLALLDHLKIPVADLVGQSMGGWPSLSLAMDHPARVRSLVLADTPAGIHTPELQEAWIEAAKGPNRPLDELGRHPAVAFQFFDRSPELAILYQQLGGFGEPKLGEIVPSLVATRHGESTLARLRCPILFIVGAQDDLFPPRVIHASARMLPSACRAQVVEIPEAGHSPYFEAAGKWNHVVDEFQRGRP